MTDEIDILAAPEPEAAGAEPQLATAAESALQPDAAAEWPDDWRARLAAGDARLEKRLGRFASPRNVVDSLLAAELRLRGGSAPPPAADGDPADVAAWRAAQGVPDDPDGYQLDLPDGSVLGEEAAPTVDAFLKAAHEAHMSADQVNRAVGWYLEHQDGLLAEQAAADRAVHDETLDRLRESWGSDFRAHVNLVHGLLDGAPEGVKENLLGARMADGTLFGDSAPALEWLSRLALAANPAATLTPAGQSGPGKAMADEIAAIERRMATDRDGYFKDEAAQARYRQLLSARDRS